MTNFYNVAVNGSNVEYELPAKLVAFAIRNRSDADMKVRRSNGGDYITIPAGEWMPSVTDLGMRGQSIFMDGTSAVAEIMVTEGPPGNSM